MARRQALVVEVEARACALPLIHVIETMRSLPVEPIKGTPPFVQGVSIIRGVPTPVVDLGMLLGVSNASGRLVLLRLGERQVALSVSSILGIRDLDASTIPQLPPLLQNASKEVIETIGMLDAEILVVLRAGWALPHEIWQALGPEVRKS